VGRKGKRGEGGGLQQPYHSHDLDAVNDFCDQFDPLVAAFRRRERQHAEST
jgi:hypothetical protein